MVTDKIEFSLQRSSLVEMAWSNRVRKHKGIMMKESKNVSKPRLLSKVNEMLLLV